MSFEESGSHKAAGRSRSRVHIAHHVRAHQRPEVRRRGQWLEVTLHVPHIPEKKFRHSVKSRYLVVWSEGAPHTRHQFVVLPDRVDPADYHLSFLNGVVDARIRLRPRRTSAGRARA